ncbi:MAG: futalosine hydrolase [Bacteroidota bacterium]|jgi:futalosine hydrolase
MSTKNLLVAATSAEINGICGHIEPYAVTTINNNWDVIVTGVGMVATVFHLTNALHKNTYSQIINVGLAGAINRDLSLGHVVNVVSDEFAFWGSENRGAFLSVFDLNLQSENEKPFQNKIITPEQTNFSLDLIQKVNGLTVQTVTGSATSFDLLLKTYKADVESMEGAAVFYVANQFDIPAVQIRAISNYVEPRNRDNWKIEEALDALNHAVLPLIDKC